MAYSCWAALSATYRTLSRSLPKGRCAPCFSMMPNGSRQVPCARLMASRNSAAVSSSQWTETLLCGEGDCAHTSEAQSALMESTSVLGKGSSSEGGPRALMLLARGDSCQVHPALVRTPRSTHAGRAAVDGSTTGGLAPLITSHNMIASSPNRAGWENVNTLS